MAGNSLVERDDAWARAAAAGASARAGTGRWLLWGALPGMGRTALLEEAVRRETAGGSMEAVHLRCSREESRFPFATVRQLFPEADDVPFAEQPAADEQRTFHRLLAHLARRVADRPALLAVDDVHLADRASRRWIGYLTRRLGACDEERAAIAPALGAALVARGRPATAIGVLHRESTATDCGELVRVLQSVAALIASHDAAEWRGAVARAARHRGARLRRSGGGTRPRGRELMGAGIDAEP
ncbi:ATP-binding protein [Streptomyces avidinii]|uniref:ATP-binding protein n=1 Tax=Streptomyces avidinii TaxID=1895 RepID=UPI0037BB717A